MMPTRLRMTLAGLTAVALLGGVMAADPADAGKKKKKRAKAKSSKSIKQVSLGGNAKAGNGGNGGAGGKSGNVANTGAVGGGPVVFGPPTGPGVGVDPMVAECVSGFGISVLQNPPITLADFRAVVEAVLEGACGPLPEAYIDCLMAAADPLVDPGPPPLAGFGLVEADFQGCLVVVPGEPLGPTGGAVFSGDAGNGGTGGNGGDATGGAAGSNTNTSSVTVTRNDHSINAG